MRTMMILLLAAVPPAAILAQNGTPTARNANAQPGQGSAKPGANLCGHVIDAGTFVDARAQNASHEEAWVIRWLDPKGTAVHSALFMGRCVAKDGDTIEGKLIVRVLPNSLAVSSRHGLTAWEAEYREMYGVLGAGPSRRGAFSDSHFVSELDPSKASESGSTGGADPDFRWNEEQEALALKPGVVLIPPPVNFSYRTDPQPGAQPAPAQSPAAKPCTPQAPQGPSVKAHVPKKASTWACVHLGICADDKPVELNTGTGCQSAPAAGQPAK